MAQKLFVGGLAFTTSNERLREFFSQVDGVESVSVVTERDTGQSRGFGFVEVATAEAAAEAVRTLNGRELDGRQLKVEIAKPPASGGGFRGGPGGNRGRGRPGGRW